MRKRHRETAIFLCDLILSSVSYCNFKLPFITFVYKSPLETAQFRTARLTGSLSFLKSPFSMDSFFLEALTKLRMRHIYKLSVCETNCPGM